MCTNWITSLRILYSLSPNSHNANILVTVARQRQDHCIHNFAQDIFLRLCVCVVCVCLRKCFGSVQRLPISTVFRRRFEAIFAVTLLCCLDCVVGVSVPPSRGFFVKEIRLCYEAIGKLRWLIVDLFCLFLRERKYYWKASNVGFHSYHNGFSPGNFIAHYEFEFFMETSVAFDFWRNLLRRKNEDEKQIFFSSLHETL